ARRLGIRVVDSDYAKAPEHPFPACWQDAADVIRWTLGQPWCSGSVALTGWSAGGSLTIGFCAPNIAKKYGLSQQETDAIKGGISFYPPMGAENDARVAGKNAKSNEWLQENGIPGIGFTMRMLDFFNACYMLKTDPSEIPKLPELTPILQSSPASVWTKPLTIVTAEYDTLRDEAEQFVQNLQADGHPDVVVYTAKETSHGWETRITLNEEQWTASTKGGLATKEAYNLVETRLKKVLGL
ncbi:alpha/beta-hydrolase, partial [Tilletiaria anomala UBC 951]